MRRTATPQEAKLWAAIRANQLGGVHFRRQQIINGFLADFYCSGAKLVIELDGTVHDGQGEYDSERTEIFNQLGLHVIRFSNDQIDREFDSVLQEIQKAAKERLPMSAVTRSRRSAADRRAEKTLRRNAGTQ